MSKADLQTIATVLTTVAFLIVVVWAYSSKNKKRFEEAANLPFADEPTKAQRKTGDTQ